MPEQVQTEEVEPETESSVLTKIRERGRMRLAVATNAAAWAIYGNDDEEVITIDPKDVAMSEVVAIRVLTQLREAGLLDNEPLLGLATTRELLEELKVRGERYWDEEGSQLHYYAVKALEDVPEEDLNYATAKKKPLVTNNTDDDTGETAEKENTE